MDLLKLCFAVYTATEPNSRANTSATGIVMTLNQSGSTMILST